MRRSNNQDAHAAVPADSPERLRGRGHLFLVADGMGAHAAGELASKIASERVPLYYLRQNDSDPVEALRSAVEQANQDIHQRGRQNPEFHNMGTTVSSLAILSEGAIIAHVGDSRIYRVRDQKLEQLTFDHSLLWEMQASGQVKPGSQASGSIPKNIITRSLGPSSHVLVDIEGPFEVRSGDRFLLCSDGLTGQLRDEEIGPLLGILRPDLAARLLVDLANLRGGPDNITAIVIDLQQVDKPVGEPRLTMTGGSTWPWPMTLATLVCLGTAGLLESFGNRGTMVVALILAIISAVVGAAQLVRSLKRPTASNSGKGEMPRRSPPYRTAPAKPSGDLPRMLDQVLVALREAAREREWQIDWAQVDSTLADNQLMKSQGRFADVIRSQAEAIVETMSQLRNQQRDKGAAVTG